MNVDSWEKALEVLVFADEHDDDEIRQLIHAGFDIYDNNGTAEDLLNDIELFFKHSMDPDKRDSPIEDPGIKDPRTLAVVSTLAACAVREHEKFENAPASKIQIIQYIRIYHTRMIIANIRDKDNELKASLADRLYQEEIDMKRPRPAVGITGMVERPNEHPEFDWFFEIPLVAAGELCEARFHNGSFGGGYDDETKSALGEPNYHIDNNCVYVPMDHAFSYIQSRQSDTFPHIVETAPQFIKDEEIRWVYAEADVIKETIDDLSKYGDNDDIWTDWDPQKNLLRLIRNAADTVDDLDPADYNKATDYYDAIENYEADGFGENSAKQSLNGVRSLASTLAQISNSEEFPSVDHRTFEDRRHSIYTVGQGSGNYREIVVDTLEDIFELPCFANMVEELKLENSGPVRKQLFNFVRMVHWLQGYHELPDKKQRDAVVSDIHDLFEKKWGWYDRETTEYQARYELRHGEVNGNTPLPMHCDNKDMEHHCIGRRVCPYNIYQSLPFPEEMYDQLDEMDQNGEYQSTI